MCCEPYVPGDVEDKVLVLTCSECGADVDMSGDCIELCCSYSFEACEECGWAPCDGSC